jgi:DNA-3-methyladenine glycosylase I
VTALSGKSSADGRIRCAWAENSDAERAYHDAEWGVPLHGDVALFEMLTLEGAQAGLSWRTVLLRRQLYRQAYHRFDIQRVAAMTDAELEALLTGSGLIRNRLKIYSVRKNAQAALRIIEEAGSLDAHLWSFVAGVPVRNQWRSRSEVPAQTDISDRMSRDLKRRGLSFVGSTICYAFMQATGMVNDHATDCFRHGA